MAGKAWVLAIGLPIVIRGCLKEIDSQVFKIGPGQVGGKVLFVEQGLGSGDIGKETTDGVTIDADGGFFGANDIGQVETVGFEERLTQKGTRHFKADIFEIGGRGEATLTQLVDVEGELGLDVGVGIFGIVDAGAVSFFKLGKLDGDGEIDGGAVTDGVADVVRERANSEGEFVGSLGVFKKAEDEVSGADVVGEVGEKFIAEGVVAEILDGASAVGVSVGLLELGFGEGGKVLEEDGPNRLLPGKVDEFLVRLDGVGDSWRCCEEQSEKCCRLQESGATVGRNRLSSFLSASTLHNVHRMGRVRKG
jgi:hypothetical protein